MPDRLFFPLMLLLAAGLVALAAIWPQGLGARSPGPFGHIPVQQQPAIKALMQKEASSEASLRAKADMVARKAAQADSPAAAPPAK